MISRVYTKLIEEMSPLMLVSTLILTSIIFTLNTSAEDGMEVESVTIIGTKKDVRNKILMNSNGDTFSINFV